MSIFNIKNSLWLCVFTLVQTCVWANQSPNVVLILADDLGFSDTQPYGGEINTPSINDLASQGVSFTNYHTAASCAPSRSMLLTGVDSHMNGVPNIPEAIPAQQKKQDNYQGVLSHNVVTVASLLYDAGYHTYMAGKWHLGKTPELLPYSRGFEQTLAMADTGSDNWQAKPYLPIYKKANWTENGQEAVMPEDFYSSELLIDKTIEFIESNASDGKPFFAYVPFLAVHLPVQAPKEFTQRYMEMYNGGWAELRKQRQLRAKKLGIVPQDSDMITMDTSAQWDSFSEDEKRYHAKRMAVYAGMVEAMDFNIGRLVAYLKSSGQYDNTVFIVTSDNGSEASGNDHPESAITKFALSLQDYENDYETLGEKGSFNSIGPSFASAAAAPLSYYKFYAGEGGMRVPLIISGPTIATNKNSESFNYNKAFTYVTDITPTILDITGVKPAGDRYGGKEVKPIIGKTMLPVLQGKEATVHAPHEAIGYEIGGNKALFKGDYKIMYNMGPVGDDEWHLFNIVTDPGETLDLKEGMPERFDSMMADYQVYEKNNRILPLPAGYIQQRQVALNGLRDIFGAGIFTFVLTLLILAAFYLVYRHSRKTSA